MPNYFEDLDPAEEIADQEDQQDAVQAQQAPKPPAPPKPAQQPQQMPASIPPLNVTPGGVQPLQIRLGQQQPQQAPASQPPPQPFTQADSLQLQRLQQGLAAAQSEADKGEISQEMADDYKQELQGKIAPLLQRQQATKQQQQQEAKQQLMDQTALQEAVRGLHQVARAQNFRDTVATFVDPLTGRTAHFTQDDKGNWEEMKFEVHQAYDQPAGEGGGTGGGGGFDTVSNAEPLPPRIPQEMVEGMEAPAAQEPQTLDEMAQQLRQPQEPQIIQGEQAGGPSGSLVHGGVRLGENPADFQTNQYGEIQRGVAPVGRHVEAEAMDRARRALRPPQMTGNPAIDAHLQAQYEGRVQDMAHQIISDQQRQEQHKSDREAAARQHEEDRQAASQEHQRQEAAKADEKIREEKARADQHELDKKKAAAEERKITDQQHATGIRFYRAQIGKERAAWQNDESNRGKPLPDRLDPKNEVDQAEQMHRDELKAIERIKSGKPTNLEDKANKDKQVQDADKELDQVAGGKAPFQMTDEEAARPSRVTADRVAQMGARIDRAIGVMQKSGEGVNSPLSQKLSELAGHLAEARLNKRPLTNGEAWKYIQRYREFDTLMRNHGQDATFLNPLKKEE